jgi:hypothetical protein
LAIGKEGQNARLAAKLTGWRIDIRSQSAAEQERTPEADVSLPAGIVAEPEPFEAEEPRRQPSRIQPETEFAAVEGVPEQAAAEVATEAVAAAPAPSPTVPRAPLGPRLRFAEDLAIPPIEAVAPARPDRDRPGKRGGRKSAADEEAEAAAAAARAKRSRRASRPVIEEEEEEEDEYAYLTPKN